MSGKAVKGGNILGPQTKTVLRKLRSEYSYLNLVTDVEQETKLLQELSTSRKMVDSLKILAFDHFA